MPYALLVELKRRGIIRTADLVGGVGEHLALRMYGGVLASNGTKAYDLTDPGDRLIQVKARVASRSEGSLKIGLKSADGFDACLVLLLDPRTLRPLMAREVTREGVLGMKARRKYPIYQGLPRRRHRRCELRLRGMGHPRSRWVGGDD
jgi:hypothetical protein